MFWFLARVRDFSFSKAYRPAWYQASATVWKRSFLSWGVMQHWLVFRYQLNKTAYRRIFKGQAACVTFQDGSRRYLWKTAKNMFGNWCCLEVHLFFLVMCYNGTLTFIKLIVQWSSFPGTDGKFKWYPSQKVNYWKTPFH